MPGFQSKSVRAIPVYQADDDGEAVSAQSTGTDRSATVTTTSAQLMPAAAKRKRLFIKNDSATDVWVNFGATAAATPGSGNVKVPANGGYFENEGYSGVVNAIVAIGTAALTAREF